MLAKKILIALALASGLAAAGYDDGGSNPLKVRNVDVFNGKLMIGFSRSTVDCQNGSGYWGVWHAVISLSDPAAARIQAIAMDAKNTGVNVRYWSNDAARNCSETSTGPTTLIGLGEMPN